MKNNNQGRSKDIDQLINHWKEKSIVGANHGGDKQTRKVKIKLAEPSLEAIIQGVGYGNNLSKLNRAYQALNEHDLSGLQGDEKKFIKDYQQKLQDVVQQFHKVEPGYYNLFDRNPSIVELAEKALDFYLSKDFAAFRNLNTQLGEQYPMVEKLFNKQQNLKEHLDGFVEGKLGEPQGINYFQSMPYQQMTRFGMPIKKFLENAQEIKAINNPSNEVTQIIDGIARKGVEQSATYFIRQQEHALFQMNHNSAIDSLLEVKKKFHQLEKIFKPSVFSPKRYDKKEVRQQQFDSIRLSLDELVQSPKNADILIDNIEKNIDTLCTTTSQESKVAKAQVFLTELKDTYRIVKSSDAKLSEETTKLRSAEFDFKQFKQAFLKAQLHEAKAQVSNDEQSYQQTAGPIKNSV